MKPTDYPNIIFDLGGVILNIDYQRTIKAFAELGAKNVDEKYSQLNQTTLFDEFERGEISANDFRTGIRKVFGADVTDASIDDAWNAMLLDLPANRLDLLGRLQGNKRLVLLSNTNAIHANVFEAEMKAVHGIEDLSGFFEKVYYSFEVGMRKPEERIFQLVIDELGFAPEETLFIDDSPQHIEGAKKVGLNAYYLRADQGETILDLFGDFLA
ncbi:MAG: HAD family phosphatase [Flavobacteriales bacterium]|nr:HAD family phosphatase [Flavobacteriales bacterium]